MGLRSHLKQHWPTWLVGAIGFGVSAYFYFQSREIRDPVFLTDPNRTEIISHARVETAPIRVLRQDGRAVTGDLYALRFYFWNAGKTSIRPINVLDTIRITLDEPAEVVDYKVLNRTRPITGLDLRSHRIGARLNTLGLTFTILEHNDGLAGQIIYEGASNARLRIAGIIEGVPAGIRDGSSFSWAGVIRYSDSGWLFLLSGALVLGLIVAVVSEVRALRRWSTPGPDTAPVEGERRRHKPRTRADLIVSIVFLFGFLAVISVSMFTKYRTVQEEARLRSVNSVPRVVLPP